MIERGCCEMNDLVPWEVLRELKCVPVVDSPEALTYLSLPDLQIPDYMLLMSAL